ncbi:MAG: FAD-dependent oxidoreductase [Candidatus Omnitrophica bacterium]|nr:FAD-dependent oxidoreductase [Candidatus Omnitrophota bacterium]
MKKRVVVLGAGVSGLTAGHELARKGFDVVVIEKSDYIGGLAATFSYKNHLIDYGPHNFHTHIPEVFQFVKEDLGVPLKGMSITASKLFFMGKFVNYPLKIHDAIRNLNWRVSMRCFFDYVLTRVKLKFTRGKNEGSFEEWVKGRYGKYVYDLYFGPYVKKVWGLPGTDLDVTVARKRIPEPSLLYLIVRSLTGFKFGPKHSEDPERVTSHYPPKGIGVISDRLRDGIVKSGGRVELSCKIGSIEAPADRGAERVVHYTSGGVGKTLKCDYLVSTIPLDSLYELLSAPGKEGIEKDVRELPYRSLILLYMFMKMEKLFDAPWIYFNERDNPDLIFNRLYEVGNFSPEMIHDKKGVLCLEVTCYENDETWKKANEDLFNICISYLEKNKFLDRSQVQEVLTKHIGVAYPIFKKGYMPHLSKTLGYLTDELGILCIGRQGLFSYANVDHCIDMGLKAGRILDGKPLRYDDFYKMYEKYFY